MTAARLQMCLFLLAAMASLGFCNEPQEEPINEPVEQLESEGLDALAEESGAITHVEVWDVESVTAEGVQLLRGLPAIESLDLTDVQLGDGWLEFLTTLSSLKRLTLSGTNCTDADLQLLGRHTKLEELAVDGTLITDDSVCTLCRLKNLNILEIDGTEVSDQAIACLLGHLPGLKLREYWDCYAGTRDGCSVLDLEKAVIYFSDPEKSGGGGFGGGGGFTILAAGADPDEDDGVFRSGGGGGGISLGWPPLLKSSGVVYTLTRKAGVPTIQANGRKIEVKNEGKLIVVDGKEFAIGEEKLEIVFDKEGNPALYTRESE